MEALAEGPGLRLNITVRFRVSFEVMIDRKKERNKSCSWLGARKRLSQGSVGCKENLAARTSWCGHWLEAMSKAQHMVCVRVKVRAERKRGPGAAAGVELERSFET